MVVIALFDVKSKRMELSIFMYVGASVSAPGSAGQLDNRKRKSASDYKPVTS